MRYRIQMIGVHVWALLAALCILASRVRGPHGHMCFVLAAYASRRMICRLFPAVGALLRAEEAAGNGVLVAECGRIGDDGTIGHRARNLE